MSVSTGTQQGEEADAKTSFVRSCGESDLIGDLEEIMFKRNHCSPVCVPADSHLFKICLLYTMLL